MWSSKRPPIVTFYFRNAKYYFSMKMWKRQLGYKYYCMKWCSWNFYDYIFCDNQNWIQNGILYFIIIGLNILQSHYHLWGKISKFEYVAIKNQLVNILTKPLKKIRFSMFKKDINKILNLKKLEIKS
jgi:hypothetical protein